MHTLEKFEITDMSRADLERHIHALYAHLRLEHGEKISACDLTCEDGKECKCFIQGTEEAECDGSCDSYDEGFADGKNEKKQEIPVSLIPPIESIRSAYEDAELHIGLYSLNDSVRDFIKVLDHSFHI